MFWPIPSRVKVRRISFNECVSRREDDLSQHDVREAMDPKSAYLGRSGSILTILLLVAAFNILYRVSPNYSLFLIRLHDVLTNFTARGQSTVELFAPLSTVFGSSPPLRAILIGVSGLVWPLVGVLFLEMLHVHKSVIGGELLTQTGLYGALLGSITWFSSSVSHENLLSLVIIPLSYLRLVTKIRSVLTT